MDSTTFATGVHFFINHDTLVTFFVVYGVVVFGGNIAAFAVFLIAFASGLDGWRVVALFGAVAVGQATGDSMWYGLGHVLRNTRLGNWVKNHLPGHARAEEAIQKKGKRYLYLSKFAYGSAGFVAFFLGWTGMPYRKFFKNSLVSITIALPVVFTMAYGIFSGLSPLTAVTKFKHIELVVLAGIIGFLVLEYLLSKAVKAAFGNGSNGEE